MSGWEPDVRMVPVGADRVLKIVLAGPSDGLPLFAHHGTGAAGMFDPLVELAAERGLRHTSYSRPGYGGSSRLAGRSVADCVDDVVVSGEESSRWFAAHVPL